MFRTAKGAFLLFPFYFPSPVDGDCHGHVDAGRHKSVREGEEEGGEHGERSAKVQVRPVKHVKNDIGHI